MNEVESTSDNLIIVENLTVGLWPRFALRRAYWNPFLYMPIRLSFVIQPYQASI